jgi:hypothetical protein
MFAGTMLNRERGTMIQQVDSTATGLGPLAGAGAQVLHLLTLGSAPTLSGHC